MQARGIKLLPGELVAGDNGAGIPLAAIGVGLLVGGHGAGVAGFEHGAAQVFAVWIISRSINSNSGQAYLKEKACPLLLFHLSHGTTVLHRRLQSMFLSDLRRQV